MNAEITKRRAVQYQRVSREEQNPQLQADETFDLIRRGWELVDSYVDHGVSGSKGSDKRPELRRMLADARRRRFDILVVWRSDRLFRSMREMVTTIEELSALGVEFVSATEPMDTTTPQGKLLLHLVSAFGEFERNVLIERTRAGLAAAKRRGVRIGRPKKHVDVQRALELRREGWSLRKIATKLGVGASTLCRALQDADVGGEAAAAGLGTTCSHQTKGSWSRGTTTRDLLGSRDRNANRHRRRRSHVEHPLSRCSWIVMAQAKQLRWHVRHASDGQLPKPR